MRPAFSSRTKRRGTTALTPALRLFFLTVSDMWHPYGDLMRNWSALDRHCAANSRHDIEWYDRRWNECASSSLSYGAAHPLPRTDTFSREGYFLAPAYEWFTDRFCDCGHADARTCSTRSRSIFRNAYLLARTMRAKFALAFPSGSKPA